MPLSPEAATSGNNDCTNCRWARWEMTNHTPPRINPRYHGRCHYQTLIPLLPRASSLTSKTLNEKLNPTYGHVIWVQDGYVDCPAWEKRS